MSKNYKRDHDKRKNIICIRCNKDKLNFGKNMCSACLRRTKRETRPSFYLGTCYSEMSRRVKTYDPLRPNYYGKEICTKEQFFNRFLNDKSFLNLYKIWQESGFKRGDSPSIDRIDNKKDYTIDNMQFIKHTINTGKDFKKRVVLIRETAIIEFEKSYEAADYLGVKRSTLTHAKKTKKSIKGWSIYDY